MRWLAVIALAGCVDQHDPDIYVTLPNVPQACALLDAAELSLEVATVQGEHFTVVSPACQGRLANQDIAGWQVALDRLADGYHRLTARITGPNGELIGTIDQPFTAKAPVLVPFNRPDLPGWPTAMITLMTPACDTLRVVATPDKEVPVVDTTLPCSAPSVAIPRGPTGFTVELHASDGQCTLASAEALVANDAAVPLVPGGSCP
jgi:hypothetical protein